MTPRENKPSCHDVMVDKWEPTSADIRGNRLPGFGVTTNIINGGLECNRPGNAAVEDRVKYYERYAEILGVSPGPNLYCGDQRPFGQDASFALSKSGGGASAGVVRVDKKGRTCSDLGKKACKKKRWCKFNRAAQTCEGGSSDPAAAASTGATAVQADRKGRTCADYGRRKCNRKSWCTYDYGSGTCQDVSADPNLAEAAVSDVRVDRRGRSCADYGKGLCQKRKWCRFDSAKGACEDKNESYLRG